MLTITHSLFLALLLIVFSPVIGSERVVSMVHGQNPNEEVFTTQISNDSEITVSNHLMGFNLIYAYERDAIWADGKVEGYLKEVETSLLRWPGGTVTSYYHWNELTGEGWQDGWDPDNPVTPKPESEYMDLDQYMELVRSTGATPLVGINMSSARRWDRMQDGIEEALDLMQYCKDNDFEVTYWYLDNEPYMEGSNGGEKTIEEYAELINAFASRMRELDPDIKIIANWRSAIEGERRDEYRNLLEIAGDQIDILDIHLYWSWSDPTMEYWLAHTPTQRWTGNTYSEEFAEFRRMTTEMGFPDMQLAALEWNVGPIRNNKLTPHQSALIQSELMMQFIIGGMDMATFWPIHHPNDNVVVRSLVNPSNKKPQPVYQLFQFLGKMQGNHVLKEKVTDSVPHTLNLATFDEEEEMLRIFFLNKNGNSVRADMIATLSDEMILQEARTFYLTDDGQDSRLYSINLLKHDSEHISFVAPAMSVSMLTFKCP